MSVFSPQHPNVLQVLDVHLVEHSAKQINCPLPSICRTWCWEGSSTIYVWFGLSELKLDTTVLQYLRSPKSFFIKCRNSKISPSFNAASEFISTEWNHLTPAVNACFFLHQSVSNSKAFELSEHDQNDQNHELANCCGTSKRRLQKCPYCHTLILTLCFGTTS